MDARGLGRVGSTLTAGGAAQGRPTRTTDSMTSTRRQRSILGPLAALGSGLALAAAGSGAALAQAGPALDVSLQSEVASRTIGANAVLTARVAREGDPVSGAQVRFLVSGVNALEANEVTGEDGRSELHYGSAAAGFDVVSVCHDADASGTCDDGEPSASAAMEWTSPSEPEPPPHCRSGARTSRPPR